MMPHLPRRAHVAPARSIALLLCCWLAGQQAYGTDGAAISWRDQYGQALEEARAANRLLWVQFTGPWCPHCTRMESDTFPDPKIIAHARESFVPLKLRADGNEQLVQSLNVTGLPATAIVAPNRDVIALQQGYLGPDEFDAFLRDALARRPQPAAAPGSASPPKGDASADQGEAAADPEAPLALAGFCAVSLVSERKLVPGKSRHTVRHDGRVYHFANADARARFQKEPQRYVPANEGCCPVARVQQGVMKPGAPQWGVLYAEHLFLCATEEDRRAFMTNPYLYAMVDVAESGYCVHCIRQSGILVPGEPRHEIARDGLRYWFPDITHRDAFLATVR
jgi:YHS domain-containing protein